jgi:hypothetical protein
MEQGACNERLLLWVAHWHLPRCGTVCNLGGTNLRMLRTRNAIADDFPRALVVRAIPREIVAPVQPESQGEGLAKAMGSHFGGPRGKRLGKIQGMRTADDEVWPGRERMDFCYGIFENRSPCMSPCADSGKFSRQVPRRFAAGWSTRVVGLGKTHQVIAPPGPMLWC